MKEESKKQNKKAIDRALIQDMGIDKDKLKSLKKRLRKIEDYPERGIETWFRVTSKTSIPVIKL